MYAHVYKGPIGPTGPKTHLEPLPQLGPGPICTGTHLDPVAQFGPGPNFAHWPNWTWDPHTYLLLERDQGSSYKVCIYTYTYACFFGIKQTRSCFKFQSFKMLLGMSPLLFFGTQIDVFVFYMHTWFRLHTYMCIHRCSLT